MTCSMLNCSFGLMPKSQNTKGNKLSSCSCCYAIHISCIHMYIDYRHHYLSTGTQAQKTPNQPILLRKSYLYLTMGNSHLESISRQCGLLSACSKTVLIRMHYSQMSVTAGNLFWRLLRKYLVGWMLLLLCFCTMELRISDFV